MKIKNSPTRRTFLTTSLKGFGAAAVSTGLMSCDDDLLAAILEAHDELPSSHIPVAFNHGVASGDPTTTAIILWTRITPSKRARAFKVSWEIATDMAFSNIIHNGATVTNDSRDYTVKVDAINLDQGSEYYYRFIANGTTSEIGKTKTLPEGAIDQVKMAVLSCSNYPAGYFNVYKVASEMDDLDVVLHLGDYIYEFDRDGFASELDTQLGREVLPAHELFTLEDYRTRYAQYREDTDLQAVHAKLAFIAVWDDHEVSNNSFKDGASGHDENLNGSYLLRQQGALQAYFEWMPIRPVSDGNELEIYRSFKFGELVDLHMLDTRVVGREKQLEFETYIDPATGAFDGALFTADISDPTRTMLGATQRQWLQTQLAQSTGTWQLLGQQVLMGAMKLPAAVALNLMSPAQYAELGGLAQLAGRAQAGDPTLTPSELAYLSANQTKLTPQVITQLQMPNIPYNLDAWDGYAVEREVILQTAKAYGKNLVVIAGDTHNSWCNDLVDISGDNVGVEFATASVSSPGLEYFINIPADQVITTEYGITSLVENLRYCNLSDRGLMTLTFTESEATSNWYYVDTVIDKNFTINNARSKQASVQIGQNKAILA
ncbi:alkaline phosphatase D family protein [Marinicellulosiphila megalodicopiae]|uniref:alkaline phosphatase D family protein n=1 Tax=Marinicellulosiphila megalodicopiae TaxID=2724896 RepID=UPI003BB07581